MMNVLALGLLFTSLVTAGFFTPTPEKQNSKENVVVKEGQRVVVEFEKDNGNTKVFISPQDYDKGVLEDMEEKLSHATEGVKGRLEEEDSAVPEEIRRGFSPTELVCDAYGRCKHKIAAAMGRTKDAAAEKSHEVGEEAGEAVGKVKDTVTDSAHRVSDKARESTENVKESAREAKDKVSEKASEMKEGAAERAEKAKTHVSEKAEEVEEMLEDASDRVEHGALSMFRRARAVGARVLLFFVPPVSLSSVSGMLHLLGFSAAYGMCIWVTFASSYVLAMALPRHQFAMVQSKIYPVYFKAMAYCVGVALFGHLLNQRKRLSPMSVGMFQASNLVASLVMVLVNLLYLEPRATKVMFERMKKEKEEGRGKESLDTEASGKNIDPKIETPVTIGVSQGSADEKQTDTWAANAEMVRMSEMLRRLNSYSSFLNVLTLMFLSCHLVYLGQRLHHQIEC